MNLRRIRNYVLINAIIGLSGNFALAQVYTPPTPVYMPPQPTYQPAPAPPVVAAPQAVPQYQPQQLDQMLGPIALYPDPLLSEVLAASTYPLDISSAARWVQSYPTFSQADIDAQPWAEAVKALVHYPTVLQMLANNLDWTQAIGTANSYQPGDVMNSIQRLRFSAQANGALYSTPQQQVVTVDGAIRIIPTQPSVVYVPQYDPAVVYYRRGLHDVIGFSTAFNIGPWLHLDFDWGNHYIVRGAHWDEHVDHVHWVTGPRWEHDVHRPVVVAPRPAVEVHRGYEVRPEVVHPLEPRPRVEVEHEEQRGHESIQRAPVHEEHAAPAREEHAAPPAHVDHGSSDHGGPSGPSHDSGHGDHH